jgi:hypothetical protein
VILPFFVNGERAWTTQGSIDMQGWEKELEVDTIRRNKEIADAETLAGLVVAQAEEFGKAVFNRIAPSDILKAHEEAHHDEEARNLLHRWIIGSGFQVIRDGITFRVQVKDETIISTTAPVPPKWRRRVEAELERMWDVDGNEGA